MHKLGEQWIEELDGKKHMLKAVEGGEHWCDGCCFNTGVGNCSWDSPKYCRNGSEYRIKDLGVLNEDGLLPSPWGGYPKIIHEVDQTRTENEEDVHYDNLWCVEIHEPVLVCTDEYHTEQEAIDAWNRRSV